MSYGVVVARSAARRVAEQLPEAVRRCMRRVHLRCARRGSPWVGATLRKPFEGQWRARRGGYRTRYRIDTEAQTVYVLDVDHRRDAYRS